jgi:inner membrane protein
MSPLTHLLASWIVAVKTTDNPRDRRLVTLAGVAPDLDGLGIFIDIANGGFARNKLHYYPEYHHWLTHGLPGALVCSVLMAALARRRCRVFWLALLTFHLHLFCDLIGSRGPDRNDIWPIYYLGPITHHPNWFWRHQWRLDGWQNMVITFVLLGWSFWLAIRHGDSFVGVFNRRADAIFVGVLRKWREAVSQGARVRS